MLYRGATSGAGVFPSRTAGSDSPVGAIGRVQRGADVSVGDEILVASSYAVFHWSNDFHWSNELSAGI